MLAVESLVEAMWSDYLHGMVSTYSSYIKPDRRMSRYDWLMLRHVEGSKNCR